MATPYSDDLRTRVAEAVVGGLPVREAAALFSGHLVGPMIAANPPAARAMAAHLPGERTGQFVRLDVPEESGLGPWLASLGLETVDTAIRMVRGPDAAPGPMYVFGLASQAKHRR